MDELHAHTACIDTITRAQKQRFSRSVVVRLEVMEGQTQLTCIPHKTLDN